MPDFLLEPFMQRALWMALALGPACGLLGVFVTARRMSFFSDTISHAALTGVAAGFLAGFDNPTLPVLAFCLLVAVTMLWLRERTRLLNDTIMAVLLSVSVALGVILLSLQRNRWAELDKYLLGDVLSVGWPDVAGATAAALAVSALVLAFLNPLALLSAHEDLAHVSGARVRLLNYGFVVLLTLAVSLSIRALGILLVTSMVVLPPAAARVLVRSLRAHVLLTTLLGLVGSVGGVLLSYPLNLPTGPTVTMALGTLFALSLAASRLHARPKA
ncbi:MAG: metal ABC transporter permease [Verrucomicrobiota bacterium]